MRNAFTTLRTSLAFYLLALLFPLSLYYTNTITATLNSDEVQVYQLKTIQNFLHLLTHKQPAGLSAAMVDLADEAFTRIDQEYVNTLLDTSPDFRRYYPSLTACWETYKTDTTKPPHECWQMANKAHTAAWVAAEQKRNHMLESLFLLLLASMIVAIAAIYIIRNQMKIQIDRHSMIDRVTGLFNDNYFHSEVKKVISLSSRHQHALSMLYFSLNDYEQITSGIVSDGSEKVLRRFGTLVNTLIRESDIACRFEENGFVIITPETSASQAEVLANRLKTAADAGDHTAVTIGIVEYDGSESVERFLNRAKQAMIALVP